MRKRKGNRLPMIGLCLLILAIMAGCAAAFRTHPQLQEKVTSIKTVAIMPPGIKVYQLAVGGDTQLMDESTAAAKQIVSTAIEKELGRHAGVVFKPFPSPSTILDTNSDLTAAGLKDELEDTQALFDSVSASVILHTYKRGAELLHMYTYGSALDQTFPEKLKNFDYSLGPDVQRLAKLANADALLFISDVDYILTGGRAALMFVATAISMGAFVFGAGHPAPAFGIGAGAAIFSVALVDATTGALLWYNFFQGASLTDPDSAADLAERIFQDLPLGRRPTQSDRSRWPRHVAPF